MESEVAEVSVNRIIKALLLCISLIAATMWLASGTSSQTTKPGQTKPAAYNKDDYVGSDACKDCHEDQFKAFSHTSHAQLTKISSWDKKVTGCESCHGPGKAHIEEGDPKRMMSFKNKTSKEISETCLTCHAGKEEHNNFRRGEHWRNDIGCTECHAPHSHATGANQASSNTFITAVNAEKPGFGTVKMLKISDPQLCLTCHAEVKHQFNMPAHHKVLEGALRCTDCHNPHGGFETKQTRLATGADAACIKCHADKQGPFTYEHAPVKTEGCVACHTPHGSANPRMLRTTVPQLCLECHSTQHGVGAEETPSFHNLAAQYKDCTACHVKIHGSRSSPVFFR